MKKSISLFIGIMLLTGCQTKTNLLTTESKSDLKFSRLALSWDEGIPLGNGTVGALVWQRDSMLRLSLDRTDLWDLRSIDSLSGPNYKYTWVQSQVAKKDYLPVQKKFDWPYDQLPAPSKIPGAALEFPVASLGDSAAVRLYLNNALCKVSWPNGTILKTFVHATKPVGWFVFENLPTGIHPMMVIPRYKGENVSSTDPVTGQDLRRLGYEQGTVNADEHSIVYHQKGDGDFYYNVAVTWKKEGNRLSGTWSVTSSMENNNAIDEAKEALSRGFEKDYNDHMRFWKNYWAQSSISIPDSVLQRQYDNEMYKFGSATRETSSPISLQAVWTADNGKLPPWKGDYHHDLNTQLSYWPAYTGNHLAEGLGYINTLWNQQNVYRAYTEQYFEKGGLAIPGVCTLTGEPMAGWIQYSLSPTVSAWLAQHFYLHYKYSMDSQFLQEKAYPFVKNVATFLEQITIMKNGKRTLEISSSPEIFDNSLQAWFKTITNYDLSLITFAFKAASELASEMNLPEESAHWKELQNQMPELDLDADGSLTFANGFPYNESHRHFSHAMAIHPLGLINWNNGEKSQKIIKSTLDRMEKVGPEWWCGYSYSWFGNMKARMKDGNGAAKYLRLFAECFCLPNTFHVNGDQTKSGKSNFQYRPFTLEGNFAFAAGIQEMLLQSFDGVVRIFPAIPSDWKNVSFNKLRTIGAFLISAEIKNGKLNKVSVISEKGGNLKIQLPGSDEIKEYLMKPGEIRDII